MSEGTDKVEVWDTTDPRSPQTLTEIDSGQSCAFAGCGDVFVEDSGVLAAVESVLVVMSSGENFVVEGLDGYSQWVRPVSDGSILWAGATRTALVQLTQTSGEILSFADEYGTAGIDVSGEKALLARSSFLSLEAESDDELALYTLATSSALVPVRRFSLDLEPGWGVAAVPNTTRRVVALVDERSAFVLTGYYHSPEYEFSTLDCRLIALFLDSAGGFNSTLAEVGGCTAVLVAGPHLFLAGNYEIGTGRRDPRVEAFRIDLTGTFPRLEHVGSWELAQNAFISDLAVEKDRGLLYILADDFFEIVDTGVLTGGEPSWP